MSLRAIHDFELALLDPCIAMASRGIRIDEARRTRMLADLTAERDAILPALETFVVELLGAPEMAARLNGKAHLFRERRVCACCRNGKAKRAACWSCAGFEAKPTKKALTERAAATILAATDDKPFDLDPILKPCAKCSGAGAFERTVYNPASPEQTKVVLYDLLRLPARTKDGKLTTDAKALKSLLAEAKPTAHAFITQLLRITKFDTIASILERIKPGPDGRIRCIYNPAGTETGRFASAESFLFPSTNLNNLPKKEVTDIKFDVRACCIPSEGGHVFVEADYSGAESWIVACCAQDHAFLDVLRSGVKPHRWTAARALGKPESEVTDQEYMLYKTARHSLDGGMQWKTFMENVNFIADRTGVAITAAQAKETYANYHKLHPNLERVWWKWVQAQLVSSHSSITTCFGRKRVFYGRNKGEWLGEAHREAIRCEPQSTIADLLNRGLLRWWRQHDGKVGRLLAQVYDSVLIEVPRERAQLAAQLVQRCLTEEIEVHGIRITVPVDVKILESWAVKEETA
jgi:DNA polymerase I-like protein with 3'-5' exonuclease and polymerase domains